MPFRCNIQENGKEKCNAPVFMLARAFKKHYFHHFNHRIEKIMIEPKGKVCEYCDKGFGASRDMVMHAAYVHHIIDQFGDYRSCYISKAALRDKKEGRKRGVEEVGGPKDVN